MQFSRLKDIDVTAWIPSEIKRWALPSVFLLLSAAMFSLAGWMYSLESTNPAPSSEAQGEVVGIKFKGFLSCPIVRFTHAGGQQVTFEELKCSNPPSHTLGEQLLVRYAQDSSWQPYISSEPAIHKAIIPALFGSLWFAVGSLLAYRTLKRIS